MGFFMNISLFRMILFLPCFSKSLFLPPPGGGALLAKIFTLVYDFLIIYHDVKHPFIPLNKPWKSPNKQPKGLSFLAFEGVEVSKIEKVNVNLSKLTW